MKTTMKTFIKICLLISLASLWSASAWSQTKRISDTHREQYMIGIREALLQHKQINNGRVDLMMMKPEILEYAWAFHYEDKLATKEEIVHFQQKYDTIALQQGWTDQQKEAALMALLDEMITTINSTPLRCIGEGQSCNQWICCDGLVCADKPSRALPKPRNNCAVNERSCSQNSDCCSGNCEEDILTKKKSCKAQKVCYRPLKLNTSCNENPVCGEGSCEEHNANTLGMGECSSVGQSCSANSECCSNSCQSGKCATNYMCKDCVKQGQVPQRGRQCCEGLMVDPKTKKCVIDLPPFVVENADQKNLMKSFIATVASLIIPSAYAQAGGAVQEVRDAVDAGSIDEANLSRGVVVDSEKQAEEDRLNALRNQRVSEDLNNAGGAVFNLRKASNFETCDINFKNDYINGMAEKRPGFNVSLYDLQLSLLAFEYMTLGSGVADLWKVKIDDANAFSGLGGSQNAIYGTGTSNMHSYLSYIAEESRKQRRAIFGNVAQKEERIKCLCYDKNGYPNLSEEKQSYYRSNCSDLYAVYQERLAEAEALGETEVNLSDASGIKYKQLMVAWYEATSQLEQDLFIAHTNLSSAMRSVKNWATTNDWNATEIKKYRLFQFSIKNYTGQVLFGTAVASALLTAGVIAITGGFAATATIGAWAAAGIITASAAAGSLGVWFVGSLKGAWQSAAPMVSDEYVKGRESYKCGKKDQCSDFNRVLNQPYNTVCNKHISANACIRSFLVTTAPSGEDRYLIDPWVPHGIEQGAIIKDNREYASLLEQGFVQGRRYLEANKPAEIAGDVEGFSCDDEGTSNCRKDTEHHVIYPEGYRPPSYLQETFVDEVGAAQFLPKLRHSEDSYRVTPQMINLIKEGARSYAISEGFFESNETANLEQFANYAWDYHYVFPKISRSDAISYPTPGLVTYFELVATAYDQNSEQNLTGYEGVTDVLTLAVEDLQTTQSGLSTATIIQTATPDSESVTSVANKINSAKDGVKDGITQIGNTGANQIGTGNFLDGSLLDGSSVAGNLGLDNLDAGQLQAQAEKFQNAIATRKRIDDEKEEAMKNFMEQVGDTDRGRRILEAQKNLARSFLSPTGTSAIGSGSNLNNLAKGDLRGAARDSRAAVAQQSDRGVIATALPSSSGQSGLYGSGNFSGSGSGRGGVNSADAQRMRDAISARNRQGSAAFETREGQTLWEIVTNTYIRMYDRLLPRNNPNRDLEE